MQVALETHLLLAVDAAVVGRDAKVLLALETDAAREGRVRVCMELQNRGLLLWAELWCRGKADRGASALGWLTRADEGDGSP
jgi:hypothetical protein